MRYPSPGIPPKKSEFRDRVSIMNHTWPFFNAQFQTAEFGSGADQVQPLKGPSTTTKEISVSDSTDNLHPRSIAGDRLTTSDARRLSLQGNQSRSFGKSDPSVAQKGYRTFTPGDYIYNFELPIDARLPETIDVELGHVKYELEAVVERAGAFRANLIGSKEVVMIRAPAEGSLEQVEPIAISRNWEDQLHYDIVISGKSFPLGSQVPIAFKLTPLAKVQCHRIKVFITENTQYYTSNKRVHRLEPTRKIQLFEKRADGPSTSAYPGSSVRITAGGGIPYDYREAAARGEEHTPRDTSNLLGNLQGESNIGPTEMEFNVQLPNCHSMAERDKYAKLHFDTTYQHIQVHHWIKVSLMVELFPLSKSSANAPLQIVMRLSKPDAVDPAKRRHFEISIDSPFHILSCRATQANIALPAYTSPESATMLTDHSACGCPGAPRRHNSPSSLLPTLGSLRLNTASNNSSSNNSNQHSSQNLTRAPTAGLTRPPVAHVHDPSGTTGASGTTGSSIASSLAMSQNASRPIHLLRNPSFNPPPFDEEEPPPPLQTPPPNYDTLVTGSRDGLADYFARLADEVGEDEDSRGTMSPGARMEIPLTPGGRVNRSMDERRTWLPIGGTIAQ